MLSSNCICLLGLRRRLEISLIVLLLDWVWVPPEDEGGDCSYLPQVIFLLPSLLCLQLEKSNAVPWVSEIKSCEWSPAWAVKRWLVCTEECLWLSCFAVRHLVSSFPSSFGLWRHLTRLIVSNAWNKWSNALLFLYLCCGTLYLIVALWRTAFNIFWD